VITDANGLASAPLFTGTKATPLCATSATPAHSAALDLSMRVFAPAEVVITVAPASVDTRVGQTFGVVLVMTVDGTRINGSLLMMRILPDAAGASATASLLYTPEDLNAWHFLFTGNGIPGSYVIEFNKGPVQALVAVTQRP
jgi:hypothetical protein